MLSVRAEVTGICHVYQTVVCTAYADDADFSYSMRSVWNLAAIIAFSAQDVDSSARRNETGLSGWLRYAQRPEHERYGLPSSIITLDTRRDSPVETAGRELRCGLGQIHGLQLTGNEDGEKACEDGAHVVIGTVAQYMERCGPCTPPELLQEDGFWLSSDSRGHVKILGQNERAVLYGAYHYLSAVASGHSMEIEIVDNPTQNVRWVNQWDNMDGSIERGYGGRSIFFADGNVKDDLDRVSEYGRLLASVRFNGLIINNVNANETTISNDHIEGLGRIADRLRPYGIRMGLSLNFASPQTLGGLDSYDPLDPKVIDWWHERTDRLYERIPDMAGYNVKADSEGQPGPLTYNRTFADGANLFARAVAPRGGIVTFRGFVYTPQNWNDWTADRAKQSNDYFQPLDGQFDDNVVLQIKYGPIDFQVQEPPSPLFANLDHSNMAIEIQVAQEYTGQGSHFVYLPPLWRTILDFDMRKEARVSTVSELISGKRTNRKIGGVAAVVNVGDSDTWLGSHLAMANLYASGRLAWDATQSSESILRDWAKLTFCDQEDLLDTLWTMAADSWPAYLNYTGVLGTLSPNAVFTHYGPEPDSVDGPSGSRWFRAYADGIGMDRTVRNGTGFSAQYPHEVAAMFEHIETTPEDLLLWFHHVPYTHRLSSGVTVLQYIYDAHYNGARRVQSYSSEWKSLEAEIDCRRFNEVLYQLEYQAGHAIVWRDAINDWYLNKTRIPDDRGRVGFHPYRIEAEEMSLDGYHVVDVLPPETASRNKAVSTSSNDTTARLSYTLDTLESGKYDLGVNYFDLLGAVSNFTVSMNERVVARIWGDNEKHLSHVFSPYLDGHSASRRTFRGIWVNKGDSLLIEGHPVDGEPAPIDYVSVIPHRAEAD